MTQRPIVPVLRLLLGTLALAAMGVQLAIHIRMGASVINFFSYFTNLSNLFAAVILVRGAFSDFTAGQTPAPSEPMRLLSVVNMSVVGIVFTVLLRDIDLGALRPWVNFVLHDLMPVAVFLDWLVRPPASRLQLKHLLLCLIFPAAYLAYVLIRGAEVSWYPYPFLNPEVVSGYPAVAAYSLGITVTFLIVGAILFALGNRKTWRLRP